MSWPIRRLTYAAAIGGLVVFGVSASAAASATTADRAPATRTNAADTADATLRALSTQRSTTTGMVHWWVLESGPNARSIVVQVTVSPKVCVTGKAKITATETPTAISVHVNQPYRVSEFCPFVLIQRNYAVPLKTPIDGRQITGTGLRWPTSDVLYIDKDQPGYVQPLVPRVVGLKTIQAFRVLQAQGFKGIIKDIQKGAPGPDSTVVAQSPDRDGTPTDTHASSSEFAGTVTLTTEQ